VVEVDVDVDVVEKRRADHGIRGSWRSGDVV